MLLVSINYWLSMRLILILFGFIVFLNGYSISNVYGQTVESRLLLSEYGSDDSNWDLIVDGELNSLDMAALYSSSVSLSPTPLPTFVPPQIIYEYDPGNDYFTAVELMGNYLFALTGVVSPTKIYVFDISDKQNIQLLKIYSLDRFATDMELDEQSKLLYLTKTYDYLYIYDVADPLNVTLENTITTVSNLNHLRIFEDQDLLFLSRTERFYVFDTEDMSKNSYYEIENSRGCVGVYDVFGGQYINLWRVDEFCIPFVGESGNYLLEFNSDVINGPEIDQIKILDMYGPTLFKGDIAYHVERGGTYAPLYEVSYWDFSNPLEPVKLGVLDVDGSEQINIWNDDLLVLTDLNTFHYFDISQPEDPKMLAINVNFPVYLSSLDTFWHESAIADDSYVYIANGRDGLVVVSYEFVPEL